MRNEVQSQRGPDNFAVNQAAQSQPLEIDRLFTVLQIQNLFQRANVPTLKDTAQYGCN